MPEGWEINPSVRPEQFVTLRSTIITAFLTLFAGTIFAVWPHIDLAISGLFFDNGFVLARSSVARPLRRVLFYLPAIVLAAMILCWAVKRFDVRGIIAERMRPYAPSGRGLSYAVITMALGPLLLVNVTLKETWDRPRPVHVQEFKGPAEFRPWWRTDGTCQKNCSFVSGEVAASFWLVAPAALTPPPVRLAATGAAIAIGTLTAAGRLAFGGHFLSDVIFAALFTLLLCQIMFRLFFGWRKAA